MPSTKIAIISQAMFVRKGLKAFLLNNLAPSLVVEEFRSVDDFRASYSFNQFSVVFIEHAFLSVFSSEETLLRQLSEIHLISVVKDEETGPEASFVTDSLHIQITEEEMLTKLEQWKSMWLDEILFSGAERELTERETNVLRLVATGMTNKEIAEKLFVSPHTVITHRKNITRKLGIQTVSGLTVYALINNLVDPTEVNK